jgi:predicted AlkP superfamily pyrophosphatase or phosphodiesterase
VDHQEHRFGVDSKETEQAVHIVDEGMGKMVKTVDSLGLPVNFIFLADHGMMDVDTLHPLSLPTSIYTTRFLVLPGGAVLHLYAKDTSAIQSTYHALLQEASGYDVYLPDQTPARWHYRKEDDVYDRIGDIILAAKPHRLFNINHRRMSAAEHGYDPALTEMHATFYAWGPAFRKNKRVGGFENVHVYPLIAKILGLKIGEKIDGNLKVLKPILKK